MERKEEREREKDRQRAGGQICVITNRCRWLKLWVILVSVTSIVMEENLWKIKEFIRGKYGKKTKSILEFRIKIPSNFEISKNAIVLFSDVVY